MKEPKEPRRIVTVPRDLPLPRLVMDDGNPHPAVAAIKAMARGQADEWQQKVVLEFIVEQLCGTYDLSFRQDGYGGERETCFSEGKRSIGLNIRRIIAQPFDALTQVKVRETP